MERSDIRERGCNLSTRISLRSIRATRWWFRDWSRIGPPPA